MRWPPNLTWKWTQTTRSFSSSKTFGSGYYSSRHTYRLASHNKRAAPVSLHRSSQRWVKNGCSLWKAEGILQAEPPGPVRWAGEGKKWMLPASSDTVHLSYTQDGAATAWSGQDQGINHFEGPWSQWHAGKTMGVLMDSHIQTGNCLILNSVNRKSIQFFLTFNHLSNNTYLYIGITIIVHVW